MESGKMKWGPPLEWWPAKSPRSAKNIPGERPAFDWLQDPQTRRGGLSSIQTAVAQGYLSGPELADRREALVRALTRLARDPELTPREVVQIGLILTAMTSEEPLLARTPRKPRNRSRRR